MRGRLGLSFLPSAEKPPLLFSSIALPFGDLKLLCGSRHYIVIQFFMLDCLSSLHCQQSCLFLQCENVGYRTLLQGRSVSVHVEMGL